MKKQRFTNGWRFANCGEEWISVVLPHDAMLHQPRDAAAPGGGAQAYFPGGSYVYEKTFEAPEAAHVIFQFEGVYKNARVSINGQPAGGCDYGYLPFFVCADGLLQPGENTIRVECENAEQPDSRWYSGAGIFRPVWMWTGGEQMLKPECVKIQTLHIEPAKILVTTDCSTPVHVTILDGETILAEGDGNDIALTLPTARLWSAENPKLYTCRVCTADDSYTTRFGIRKISWDANGLYINGDRTLLRGGCIHHDNGILGAAAWDEAEYRRAKILKDAGFNAIRSAHNPISRAMLEACDELGLYIMDESWDMWFHHKSKFDYAGQWRGNYLSDLQAMVDRDFNHPSVILYSIGNEVSEPAKPEGIAVTKEMVAFLHRADPTRAVTGGFNLMIISRASKGKGIYNEDGGMASGDMDKQLNMNSTMFNMITSKVGTGMNKAANSEEADRVTTPSLDALDIAGYNYASGRYPIEGRKHPGRLVVGSETFPQDIVKNWRMVEQYPWLLGDFMWTAWDYLGEVGIGAWAYSDDGRGFSKPYPWLLADVGAFDILGNPTAEVYLAQGAWKLLNKPAIAVQPVNHPGVQPAKAVWRGTNAIPSWSWKSCEGNPAVVEVYSNAPIVELLLNGVSLGKKKVKDCMAVWNVKYAPGELKAVNYDANGQPCGESILRSASGQLRISAKPETTCLKPGQLVYVDISIADADGIVESNADETLTVSVRGGKLIGFGSAAPRTEERYDSGTFTTYYGHALAAVLVEEPGTVKLSVTRA